MDQALQHFFGWFGMPSVGLPAVFISAFISATLVPIGSEPILFGYTELNPSMYWIAIFVATIGNTLGGMLDWWLGPTHTMHLPARTLVIDRYPGIA